MPPRDGFGHGTHVAGILAGNGYNSSGRRRGIARRANLIALKALDDDGLGFVSNVIEAIDYAVANRTALGIRVINLSVGAGVYESYDTDPLAQATKRAVDAGIVVVTSAGNLGQNAAHESQLGGITSPGNAPWVLTVGASSHQGTVARGDDAVAAFSSRGPDVARLLGQARSRGAGRGHRVAGRSTQRALQRAAGLPAQRRPARCPTSRISA